MGPGVRGEVGEIDTVEQFMSWQRHGGQPTHSLEMLDSLDKTCGPNFLAYTLVKNVACHAFNRTLPLGNFGTF